MIEMRSLSLEQAQGAINAALAAAKERDSKIAIVVVDKFGELLACARMDGRAPRYLKAAHRKAYTAAVFERDSLGLLDWWKEMEEERGHRGPADWNDPMLTTLPGGFVVVHGNEVVGGIGNSGGTFHVPGTRDVDFAEIALQSLGPGYRHREDWS